MIAFRNIFFERKIQLSRKIRWFISIFLITVGLITISNFFWAAFVLLLTGIYCSPPAMLWIDFQFDYQISRKRKIKIVLYMIAISILCYFSTAIIKKSKPIIVATKTQLKKLTGKYDNFVPLNNPIDSSVFQVKNYILADLNKDETYEPLEWSSVFIIGEECWVRHKYVITDKEQKKTLYHRNFWMDEQGEILNVQDIE